MTLLSKNLVQLKELRIGYGVISIIQPGFFKKIEILDLHYNRIQIKKDFFGNETTCYFPELVKLNLLANSITNINNLFWCLENLKSLRLSGNPILSVLNYTFLTLPSLEFLFMSNLGFRFNRIDDRETTPLHVHVLMYGFLNWIRKEKSIFKNYPELYHCKTPPEKDGELIKDAIPTNFECSTDNELFTAIATSLSLSGIVFVIIFSLIFRLRWHIRYWLYLYRVKKKGFSLISNEETDYKFEAYVIYCDNDLQWIRKKLLEKIENESGISLCIRDRDFEVGKVYVENIIEKMTASRRIVLVISHDMVKSSWCLFESRIAQEKCLNMESDALIILMVEEVSEENMSSSLRAFVNSASFSKFPTKEYDERQFWLKLTKLLRKEK
ncbi:toll-like receptor 6 [Mytilus californianus]|uniref:toll-like receptor 6 n=1 Tax=Mytilus californianus TaxID=6549 RepID=UPI00224676BF|nr:toll-like receptor 6 [Mytilus californianus]